MDEITSRKTYEVHLDTVSNNSVSMSRLVSIEARFYRVATALDNMESDDVSVE